MNITISVPDGTTNHGNPQLLCVPSAWTDILTFLVTNYYAHAVTVLLDPGLASRRTIALIFAALILPFSSISRAVKAMSRHAVTERKNPLKRAARSRALYGHEDTKEWALFGGFEDGEAVGEAN